MNDYALIDLAAHELHTNSYQILKSAMIVCNDQLFVNHLDIAFYELMMGSGKVAIQYRQYIIKLLYGKTIFIEEHIAVILA